MRRNSFIITIIFFTAISAYLSLFLTSANSTPIIAQNLSTNESTTNDSSTNFQISSTPDKIRVAASFYPIFEFVKRIGGDRVEVSSLIPVGIEPHDYEPTIQQVQNAQMADMLVINGAGFEGGWVRDINPEFLLDTSMGLNLTKPANEVGSQSVDPHIWLDPILAKQQVKNIRDGLIKVDPTNSAYYKENAKRFISDLDTLDKTIKSELSSCEKKDFIAFHNAFSYFSKRYGLTQHSIQGVSPEADILPQRLQQIVSLARNMGLDTIYTEELADPRFASVLAQEIPNGKVLVLSPIEGIDKEEQNAGVDYLDKMKENIENLKVGLKCS
jgi:zinc transport system substrate-binding protein